MPRFSPPGPTSAARRMPQVRLRAFLALLPALIAGSFPTVACAQLTGLAPTFASLNGGSVWSSLGHGTSSSEVLDGRPLWRWGFAAFYGPFGGRGDTVVTFTHTVSDSADTTSLDGSAPGSRRTYTTRQLRGETKRLGGGKVTLLVGYQHSSFYRFGTPFLPGPVPVGGVFVASLLGPYPLPMSKHLAWSGGVGGTIVRLTSLALRADTLATELTSERTFAPEAMLLLMYGVSPGYRVVLGASYQYLRFGSLSYHAMQPGDRIPAAILRTLPRNLELQSVHVSLGFSFAAMGLIPGH